MCVLSRIQLLVILGTIARQAPLSMGFPRQKYWSGLPFPPSGNLLNPGIEPTFLAYPALVGGFFTSWATSSVQFSRSVASDSLRPHEPQHTRPPCPSPTPWVTQIHVHLVRDAIQPSYPLSSPSPPAFNLSQHQCLFQGVSSLHQVAKGLEFQLQHQSFQWTPRTDLL